MFYSRHGLKCRTSYYEDPHIITFVILCSPNSNLSQKTPINRCRYIENIWNPFKCQKQEEWFTIREIWL